MTFHRYFRRHWFRSWTYYWAEIANGVCGVLTLGLWNARIAEAADAWLMAPLIKDFIASQTTSDVTFLAPPDAEHHIRLSRLCIGNPKTTSPTNPMMPDKAKILGTIAEIKETDHE